MLKGEELYPRWDSVARSLGLVLLGFLLGLRVAPPQLGLGSSRECLPPTAQHLAGYVPAPGTSAPSGNGSWASAPGAGAQHLASYTTVAPRSSSAPGGAPPGAARTSGRSWVGCRQSQRKKCKGLNFMCSRNNSYVACLDPLDPTQCPPGTARRKALVVVFDLNGVWKFKDGSLYNTTYIPSWYRSALLDGADLILLVPGKDAFGAPRRPRAFNGTELAALYKYLKIVEVPWVEPPGLSPGVPRMFRGFHGKLGPREFMRLHLFGLADYDAAIYIDTDVKVQGSLRPLYDCAAAGKFLSGRDTLSAVNSGFFAGRPDQRLLDDMLAVLRKAKVTGSPLNKFVPGDGWNGMPWGPPTCVVGQFTLQGFLYYYVYQRQRFPVELQPEQLDPCSWTGGAVCSSEAAATCQRSPLLHKISCDGTNASFVPYEKRGPRGSGV